MTRSSTEYADWQYSLTDWNDSPASGTYMKGRVLRSDIVQNGIDPTGWRNPSPYEASGFTDTLWIGSGWYQRKPLETEPVKSFGGTNMDASPLSSLKPPTFEHVIDAEFPSWLEKRAINRALSDLKDSTVNYGVALAEAGKASNMVASTAKTIGNSLLLVRRGKMKEAAKELGVTARGLKNTFKIRRGHRADREMSKRWLELQYGWMPLLGDIFGVIEDFEKGIIREPRIAVTKTSKHKSKGSKTVYAGRDRKGYDWRGTLVTEVEHIARVRLDYVLDVAAFQTLAQKGVTNPMLIAWELLPWSFVWDWFNPIGEYLQTLDATLGLTFKAGSVTHFTRRKTVGDAEYNPAVFHAPTIIGASSGNAKRVADDFSVSRRVLTNSPDGGIYFKNPFSAAHALNALALLGTIVKRK